MVVIVFWKGLACCKSVRGGSHSIMELHLVQTIVIKPFFNVLRQSWN